MALTENAKLKQELDKLSSNELSSYDRISKVERYRIKKGGIHLFCRTMDNRPASVKIEQVSEKIFKVVALLGNKVNHAKIPWLQAGKTNMRFNVRENSSGITLQTEDILITIGKNPWSLYFNWGRNKELCENIYDKDVSGAFESYPLGFGKRASDSLKCAVESFEIKPQESFYGLGERFEGLDKRSKKIVTWSQAPWGTVPNISYKPVPFFISSRSYGVLVNTTYPVVFDFDYKSYHSCSILVPGEALEYFIFFGGSPLEVLQNYLKVSGLPVLPPQWAFGYWQSSAFFHKSNKTTYVGYYKPKQVRNIAKRFRKEGFPCDVISFDAGWSGGIEASDDETFDYDFNHYFVNPRTSLQTLKSMGFKVCVWQWPYVKENFPTFQELVQKKFLVLNKSGRPYQGRDGLFFIDFTNPEARIWVKQKVRRLKELGVSAFMTDFGEYAPSDGVYYNGQDGLAVHNLYPALYQRTVYEVTQEDEEKGLIWGRAGYAGSQQTPAHWAGDNYSSFQSLASVIRAGLNASISGIPFWSHDIGGWFGQKKAEGVGFEAPSEELYLRWAQFGFFSPLVKAHGYSPREPWVFSKQTARILKKFAVLRYRLMPYIYSCAVQTSRDGIPLIRPMFLEFPCDPCAKNFDLQYMLGPSILVSPVCNELGKTNIYLPSGLWLDFWSGKKLSGPKHIELNMPLSKMPLFIRENSIIPFGPRMNFVREKPWNPLLIRVFVTDRASFHVEGEGQTHIIVQKSKKALVLETHGPVRKYKIQLEGLEDVPVQVRVNDKVLWGRKKDKNNGAVQVLKQINGVIIKIVTEELKKLYAEVFF